VQPIQRPESRWNPWVRRLVLFAAVLVTAFAVLWYTPTPYYITAPGAAIDTARLVKAQGGTPRAGHLYMLVLNTSQASLLDYLYAKVDRRAVLENQRQYLGDIPDYAKYLELTRQMMADSQMTAKALAEQRVGLGKGVVPQGVQVIDLATGSPSLGILQKQDVIVAMGGRPIRSLAELQSFMAGMQPGTPLVLRIQRGGREQEVTVITGEDPQQKGRAILGIFPKDNLTFDIPVSVQINSGSITGPSAGLMFTLQLIDQLSPEGLAGDLKIAGTGTIEPDGSVGTIGGVQQKVFTAEAAGAQFMFVPRGNYADAQKVATRVQLIPVDSLDDALAWLKAHRTAAGHSSPAAWL